MLIGVDASKTSRVIQGVSAAVRFLGAAAILKSSTDAKEEVEGLTTAAGIWFTTAIGVAVGVGKEFTALISTVVALIVLTAVPQLTRDKKEPTQYANTQKSVQASCNISAALLKELAGHAKFAETDHWGSSRC